LTSNNDYAAPNEALRAKVATAASWTTALHLGARAIELVFTIVLTRLLSPAEFGIVAAAMVFVQLARLFVELGVGAAIVQAPALTRNDIRTAGTLIAVSALIFFTLTQLTAPLVAAAFGIAQVEGVLRVLGFMFLIQAIGVGPENLLIRELKAPKVVAVEAVAKLVGFGGVGVACALGGLGFWSLAAGALADALIKAVVLFAIVRPPVTPILHVPSVRMLLGKGTGFSLSRLLNFVALSADKFIAGRALGPAGLGLYGRAYSLMSLPADLYGRIAERLVFPALASVQANDARLRRAFISGVSVTATLGLPLGAVLVLTAPELIRLLFGPRWTGAIAPFAILAAASFFRLGAKISGSLLRATGALTSLVVVQATYAVAVVSACLIAAPYGIEALAWSVSGSTCVFYLLISACACAKTRTSARDFIAAHAHGVLLSVLIGLPLAALIVTLRAWDLPDAATLTLVALPLAIAGIALVAASPRKVLGAASADLAAHVRSATLRRAAYLRRGFPGAAPKAESP
jgi:PST family polysaccharide transporter